MNSLDHEISRQRRYPGALCLLMLDIDGFTPYNNEFGHVEGDILLKEVAKVIKGNIREVDIACRYASDQFVIILPETELSQAEIVAAKIGGKIEDLRLKRKISASVGVVQYLNSLDRYEFIFKADSALNHVKRAKNSAVKKHGHHVSPSRE